MEGVQAGTENSPRTESGNSEFQAIPIRLRGQIIGAVNLRSRSNTVSKETIAIVEQVADRLASALENARLTEGTRRRAQRDALVTELTGRFRSTLDLETILRTATQEFQRAFELEEAEVRIGFPTTESDSATKGKPQKNDTSRE